MKNLKTDQKASEITIQAKEHFDDINGNSYFAAQIIVKWDDGTIDQYYVPFEYGYGSCYQVSAGELLIKKGIFDQNLYSHWREFDGVKINATIDPDFSEEDVRIWGGEI